MRQNLHAPRQVVVKTIVAFVTLLASVALSVPHDVALAASGTVTGTVFKDYNSNGEMDTAIATGVAVDVGVAGIRVRAFDSTGAKVGETFSGADGTYSLTITGAATSDVRIEFEIPSSDSTLSGLVPSYAPTTATSPDPRSGTSIQFVTVGATDANFSVIDPTEYCQNNPKLLTCMFPMGDATGKTAPGAVLFSSSLTADPGIPNVGYNSTTVKQTADRLGSVFGIGIDRSGSATTSPNAFIGTYVKRTSEYGDAGATNTIYRLTVPSSGAGTLSTFVTLSGTLPAHTKTSTTALFTGVDYAEDTAIFSEVGRIGLGDVDVTPDGSTVLAVDMNEAAPKLYFIPIIGTGGSATAGTPTSKSIAKPATFGGVACPGNWHPMGIGVRGSRILVGGVCGAENTVSSLNPNGTDPTPSTAFVLEYSGALDGTGSFSTIYAMNLSYERGCALREDCSNTTSTVGSRNTADWGAWNEYPNMFSKYGKLLSSNPQAMLANIEIADDGDLILDFRDRYADQQKTNSAAWSDAYDDAFTDPPLAYPQIAEIFSAGDILRVCNSSGTLTFESGGTCAGLAGSESTDPSGTSEFYYDPFPFYGNSSNDDTVHPETALGSSATMAGYPGVWSTAYDIDFVNQQGVLSFGSCDARTDLTKNCRPIGTTTGYGSRIGGVKFPFTGGGYTWATQASFEKGNGLADLELLCNQAPVQIGNRVWIDTDMDGIQDPGETPVAGVVVHLYNSSGTLVGTAVTNAAGEYYFSSSGTEASDGGVSPDAYGYGLTTGATFTVRFDDPDNYATGGPLVGYLLTSTDSTTASTFDLDNLIDNDATAVSAESEPIFGINSFPRISVPALDPGTNDHSFDVGFYPLVAVSNFVWIDQDENGVQDAGELPLAGVTVQLYEADGVTLATKADGSPATATTNASGQYVIDGLNPGDYRLKFTLPTAYTFTDPTVGSDETIDSNPDATTGMTATFTISSSVTGDTTVDSDSTTVANLVNTTIDAGVVPTVDLLVGMGNYVWIDQNRDGIQTAGELVLPGVVVTLYETDGVTPVLRFDGLPATATTDENGYYFIDGLLPGTYRAQFTLPDGYTFTTQSVGGDTTVDSNPVVATGMTPSFTIAATATGDTTVDSTNTTLAEFVNLTIDAGVVPEIPALVAMGDYVWIDTDQDGVQDGSESSLAGVVVTLYEADGVTPALRFDGKPATATTDASGYYFIDGLAPGDYRALFVPPTGYGYTQQTAGDDSTVDSNPDIATGMTPVFSITASVTGDTVADVDQNTLAEYVNPTIDAGFIPLVGVGNYVWVDKFFDGDQDVSDPKLAGIVVTLYEADGVTPVLKTDGSPATATTDANGYYLIDGLAPGTYRAQFDIPNGYYFTTQNAAGTTTLNDSNVDPATGLTPSFTLTASATGSMTTNSDSSIDAQFINTTIDAGIVPYIAVGDRVWMDTDGDGVQDPGEPGLPGVVVTLHLYDSLGNRLTEPALKPDGTVATATTDANGDYVIDGLWSGSPTETYFYWADFDLPPGYTFTTYNAPSGDTRRYTLTDSNVDPATGETSYFMTTPYVSAYYGMEANTDPNVNAAFIGVGIDAGVSQDPNILVAMGNYVWIDSNSDGIQDVTEAPLAGVVVQLYEADGVTLATKADGSPATATTDASGLYLIDGLEPGDYRAKFTLPANYAFTTATAGTDDSVDSNPDTTTGMTSVFTIYPYPLGTTEIDTNPSTVALYVNPTIDAGVIEMVSVGDYVFIDVNADGLQDGGDLPLEGVTLTITNLDGTTVTDVYGDPVTTTTTDEFGHYSFDNLPLGQYIVTVTPPLGYAVTEAEVGSNSAIDSSTDSATSAVLDSAGDRDSTLDFGFIPVVSVGNYVWLDSDRDGIQDLIESGIEGVTLTITNADGTAVTDIYGDPVTTTTTDKDGYYIFTNLPLGQYIVTVTPPTGLIATVTGSGTTSTDSSTGSATSADLITEGASDMTLDFGFVEPSVSVGNYVWMDTNRDGVQNSSEKGIAGVTLSITKVDGSAVTDVYGDPVTTTTTDADGRYTFDNLPVGQYKVTVVPPPAVLPTRTGAGTTAIDSSKDTATSVVLTTNGQRDPTLDFGFYPIKVSVGNWVWRDLNGDGYQSKVDWGLAGATLRIFDASGNPARDVNGKLVPAQKTGRDGKYLFTNLPPGTYTVKITYPSGFRATTKDRPSRERNSSTGRATSLNLQTDGASDLSLDFGVVGVYPRGILPPTR